MWVSFHLALTNASKTVNERDPKTYNFKHQTRENKTIMKTLQYLIKNISAKTLQ